MLVGLPLGGLPVSGHVVDLVAANVANGHRVVPAAGRREAFGVRNSGSRRKRIRLNRKTPGKDCNLWIFLVIPFLVTRGGAVIRMVGKVVLLRPGQEWVNSLGCAYFSRLACSEVSCLLRFMREVM